MELCEYKNILGEPRKGVHSYRLYDIAYVDVLLTIIGAYILSKVFNASFIIITILLFILGIILHKIFCVETTINKLIFG